MFFVLARSLLPKSCSDSFSVLACGILLCVHKYLSNVTIIDLIRHDFPSIQGGSN